MPPRWHRCEQQGPLALPTHLASLYAPLLFIASYPTVSVVDQLYDLKLLSLIKTYLRGHDHFHGAVDFPLCSPWPLPLTCSGVW